MAKAQIRSSILGLIRSLSQVLWSSLYVNLGKNVMINVFHSSAFQKTLQYLKVIVMSIFTHLM
uniref:Uncharacterized protein n=1 Tax=Anguilla anguilla TaxID=7936 RepID=A0A0E9T1K9_ANGAN